MSDQPNSPKTTTSDPLKNRKLSGTRISNPLASNTHTPTPARERLLYGSSEPQRGRHVNKTRFDTAGHHTPDKNQSEPKQVAEQIYNAARRVKAKRVASKTADISEPVFNGQRRPSSSYMSGAFNRSSRSSSSRAQPAVHQRSTAEMFLSSDMPTKNTQHRNAFSQSSDIGGVGTRARRNRSSTPRSKPALLDGTSQQPVVLDSDSDDDASSSAKAAVPSSSSPTASRARSPPPSQPTFRIRLGTHKLEAAVLIEPTINNVQVTVMGDHQVIEDIPWTSVQLIQYHCDDERIGIRLVVKQNKRLPKLQKLAADVYFDLNGDEKGQRTIELLSSCMSNPAKFKAELGRTISKDLKDKGHDMEPAEWKTLTEALAGKARAFSTPSSSSTSTGVSSRPSTYRRLTRGSTGSLPPRRETLLSSKTTQRETKSNYKDDEVVAEFGNVTIYGCDYNRLYPGQFLNDVIINFYIKYIMNFLSDPKKLRVHIYNTFFAKHMSECKDHYSSVRSWTKKFDIFDKDFLIIPINEHAHWYLAVVCFPRMRPEEAVPELLSVEEYQSLTSTSASVPVPMHIEVEDDDEAMLPEVNLTTGNVGTKKYMNVFEDDNAWGRDDSKPGSALRSATMKRRRGSSSSSGHAREESGKSSAQHQSATGEASETLTFSMMEDLPSTMKHKAQSPASILSATDSVHDDTIVAPDEQSESMVGNSAQQAKPSSEDASASHSGKVSREPSPDLPSKKVVRTARANRTFIDEEDSGDDVARDSDAASQAAPDLESSNQQQGSGVASPQQEQRPQQAQAPTPNKEGDSATTEGDVEDTIGGDQAKAVVSLAEAPQAISTSVKSPTEVTDTTEGTVNEDAGRQQAHLQQDTDATCNSKKEIEVDDKGHARSNKAAKETSAGNSSDAKEEEANGRERAVAEDGQDVPADENNEAEEDGDVDGDGSPAEAALRRESRTQTGGGHGPKSRKSRERDGRIMQTRAGRSRGEPGDENPSNEGNEGTGPTTTRTHRQTRSATSHTGPTDASSHEAADDDVQIVASDDDSKVSNTTSGSAERKRCAELSMAAELPKRTSSERSSPSENVPTSAKDMLDSMAPRPKRPKTEDDRTSTILQHVPDTLDRINDEDDQSGPESGTGRASVDDLHDAVLREDAVVTPRQDVVPTTGSRQLFESPSSPSETDGGVTGLIFKGANAALASRSPSKRRPAAKAALVGKASEGDNPIRTTSWNKGPSGNEAGPDQASDARPRAADAVRRNIRDVSGRSDAESDRPRVSADPQDNERPAKRRKKTARKSSHPAVLTDAQEQSDSHTKSHDVDTEPDDDADCEIRVLNDDNGHNGEEPEVPDIKDGENTSADGEEPHSGPSSPKASTSGAKSTSAGSDGIIDRDMVKDTITVDDDAAEEPNDDGSGESARDTPKDPFTFPGNDDSDNDFEVPEASHRQRSRASASGHANRVRTTSRKNVKSKRKKKPSSNGARQSTADLTTNLLIKQFFRKQPFRSAAGGSTKVSTSEESVPLVRRRPCILLFDSLDISRGNSPIVQNIRKYLSAAWADKHSDEEPRTFDSKWMDTINVKVPTQSNNCDCGVFVIEYISRFLGFTPPDLSYGGTLSSEAADEDRPIGLPNYFSTGRKPIDMTKWFDPTIITRKRREIREIIEQIKQMNQLEKQKSN